MAVPLVLEGFQGLRLVVAVCTVVVAATLGWYQLFRKRGKPARVFPPGPRGIPVMGNLLQMGSLPHRSMLRLLEKYGPLMQLHLGSMRTLVTDHPKIASEFLREQDHIFCSRPEMAFTRLIAYDAHDFAMSPYGPHWRHMRRICVHELLTPKRLETFQSQRREEANCLVRAVWDSSLKGVDVDLRDVLASLSMNVMTRMLLGKRHFGAGSASADAAKQFKHLIHELFRLMGVFNIGDFIPSLGWLDLQGYEKQMKELRREVDIVFDAVIAEHRDQLAGNLPAGNANDFVNVLLSLPGENGEARLNDKTIKALLIDMMAGGTDTSSVTNEWAMCEILRNPRIQRKIQEEIDSVVGHDRNVEESDLNQLPYLMCVVKESFRLHPAGPFSIPRMAMEDAKVAGYDIPKGTRLLVSFHALGRNPALWSEPLKFIPERWEGANLSDIRDPELRILPFGHGRRGCPGSFLGQTLVLLTLSRLLHGFNWSLPAPLTPETVDTMENFGFTTPLRTPLRALATPRLPAHLYL